MKRFLHLFLSLLLVSNIFAQAPQRMSYQAVIRNNSNVLITSAPVGIKISILQGSAAGVTVYSETNNTSTNANGLISVEIGGGANISGSLTAINWAAGPYFIKTETDPTGGTNYTIVGTSQLLSVPYALYAGKAGNGLPAGSTKGEMLYWDGTQWMMVIVGLPGQFLQLSSSFVPTWAGPAFASITTASATSVTSATAVSGGNITSDGGAPVTARGVVWSTATNPTISLATKTSDGAGVGAFVSNLTGLAANTTYYVRAYATNAAGTVYGNQISFTTPNPVTLNLRPANNPNEVYILGTTGINQTDPNSPEIPATAWTISGTPVFGRSVFKFDLSSIPTGATIVSAKLSLYSNPTPLNGNLVDANSGSNNAFFIRRVTTSWVPASVSWLNQPTSTTTDQVSVPHTPLTFLDIIDVEVKNLVQTMLTSGNNGFMIILQNETPFTIRNFCSSKYSNAAKHPKLVITYQ